MSRRRLTDRGTIAHLASRVRGLRESAAGAGVQRVDMHALSPYQLDVLEECLLTRLTLMTKGGWCWFREDGTRTEGYE